MRTPQAQRHDVYHHVTQQIVAAIEQGAGTWRCPWHHDGSAVNRPTNVASGKRYRTETGAMGAPGVATAEQGQKMLNAIADKLAEKLADHALWDAPVFPSA